MRLLLSWYVRKVFHKPLRNELFRWAYTFCYTWLRCGFSKAPVGQDSDNVGKQYLRTLSFMSPKRHFVVAAAWQGGHCYIIHVLACPEGLHWPYLARTLRATGTVPVQPDSALSTLSSNSLSTQTVSERSVNMTRHCKAQEHMNP